MSPLDTVCRIDAVSFPPFSAATVHVLRLDVLHPVISGNKWFKLKEYLNEARKVQKTVLTFGGAYSNHIVATAAVASQLELNCIGIIRGEEPALPSPTLRQAAAYGMKLFYVSREEYRNKRVPEAVTNYTHADDLYIIPEGGYGVLGKNGAADILHLNSTSSYTHIVCAVGTGTTLAGLITAAGDHQKLIGISALKNNLSLQKDIDALLPDNKKEGFTLFHEYHFGGYAKRTNELIQFMNAFFESTGISTDFVYTGKTFFGAFHLLQQNFFTSSDRLLLVHTGGLQGNVSLPKGTLIFG